MRFLHSSWLLAPVLAALALAAAPPPSVETLLHDGDAAFARGEYTQAAALYEQAELHSTDPGRVAFRLAGVKYRLAEASDSDRLRLLHEAETLYRCAAAPGEPDRGQALYGLACCLLEKAESRKREAALEAIRKLEECLAATDTPPELAERARHNLERARLLAWQVRPSASPEPKEPPDSGSQNPRPRPPEPMGDPNMGTTQSGAGQVQPKAGTTAMKTDPRMKPEGTSNQGAPDEGKIPPIPDHGPLQPLPREEALKRLSEAHRRVLEEQQAFRQRTARGVAPNVPDW
jgi:tetratricopeptide (TPR) repeat protein